MGFPSNRVTQCLPNNSAFDAKLESLHAKMQDLEAYQMMKKREEALHQEIYALGTEENKLEQQPQAPSTLDVLPPPPSAPKLPAY